MSTPSAPAARGIHTSTGAPKKTEPRGLSQTRRGVGAGVERPPDGATSTPARPLKFTQDSKSAYAAEKVESLRGLNSKLAQALRATGKDALAGQIEECHTGWNGWKCTPCGGKWAEPKGSCQIRLCAFDMRARRIRVLRQFAPVIAALDDPWREANGMLPRYMVLSEGSVGLGDLEAALDHLDESLERLRHTKLWKKNVNGAVAALEITFNAAGSTRKLDDGTLKTYTRDEWHPHLNVIFDGQYIPQRWLSNVWRRCTEGRGSIVWITRPRHLAEVFKYVTKLADITSKPEAVAELLHAIHGARFIRTYGSLFGLGVKETEEKKPRECPDCKSQDVHCTGVVATDSVFIDGQGVFRFAEQVQLPMAREDLDPATSFGARSVAWWRS